MSARGADATSAHDALTRVAIPVVLAAALVVSLLLAGRSEPSVGASIPEEYVSIIEEHGSLCATLNPARLAAQLYQESKFNSRAVSSAGARGIAQFIPETWDAHGIDANQDGQASPEDPEDAIPAAAAYDCHLAELLADVPGDPVANMLAGYNAGPYAVLRYGGMPPYPETRGYVRRIKALERDFAEVFQSQAS